MISQKLGLSKQVKSFFHIDKQIIFKVFECIYFITLVRNLIVHCRQYTFFRLSVFTSHVLVNYVYLKIFDYTARTFSN